MSVLKCSWSHPEKCYARYHIPNSHSKKAKACINKLKHAYVWRNHLTRLHSPLWVIENALQFIIHRGFNRVSIRLSWRWWARVVFLLFLFTSNTSGTRCGRTLRCEQGSIASWFGSTDCALLRIGWLIDSGGIPSREEPTNSYYATWHQPPR